MQEIGRLLFTRKDGESFVVGTDTTITLHRRPHAQQAKAVIKRGTEETIHIAKNREPMQLEEGIHFEVSFDRGGGNAMRVLVAAPKNVKVLRSELIGNGRG